MTTRRSIQMFLLAIAAIATVPFSAHAQYQRPAQVTRQVDARAITWQRIGQSITVEFDENKLEDVMRFISDFSGADLEPLWEDDRRSGLDRDAEVTLSVENVTVLTLIERVL